MSHISIVENKNFQKTKGNSLLDGKFHICQDGVPIVSHNERGELVRLVNAIRGTVSGCPNWDHEERECAD